MAKKSDFQHDVLLIVATILFFSFFTGAGVDDADGADGDDETLALPTPVVIN